MLAAHKPWVSKKSEPSWELGVTAYAEQIVIDTLTFKDPNAKDEISYQGPAFRALDENHQKTIYKYPETRVIKPSTIHSLHEYMINKDVKEYIMWLKNFKKLIETWTLLIA
ncbi:hypothetical protein K7X08_033610 [Anisodus acutangulus]|uniref:Uncharacterized protein n=1 Tax=Anisodus acutangulus TaxID=402998 RepID=A0A9Q1RCR6_9SOLA|nr:hypothetical protein K7X08_033610 [Anisodus acutangulus]